MIQWIENMTSSDWAAWVGAIGSVLAVGISICVARNSHREQLTLQKEMYQLGLLKPMQYTFALVAQVQVFSRWVEYYLTQGLDQELESRGYLLDHSEDLISEIRSVDVRDFSDAYLVYAFNGLLENMIGIDALLRRYRSAKYTVYDPVRGVDILEEEGKREENNTRFRGEISVFTNNIKRAVCEFGDFAEKNGMPNDSPLAMVVKFEDIPPVGEPVRPYPTHSSHRSY